MRRFATGTLAELTEDALQIDILSRTLGFLRIGKSDLQKSSPIARGIAEAFCSGINAYIASSIFTLPVEMTFTWIAPQKVQW